MPTQHLLIVDDDLEIRSLLTKFFVQHGYRVSVAADGRAMQQVLQVARIDLIVLDVMLPGEDGLSLCRRLRADSAIPIIMLTAKGEDTDRIIGLEMGADDYLPKDFNPRELLSRVRAVLRRSATPPAKELSTASQVLEFHGWRLVLTRRQLFSPAGVLVPLRSGEYDLLLALVVRPQRVLTRDQLLDLVSGRGERVRPQHRRADQPVASQDRNGSEGTGIHQDGAKRRLCFLRRSDSHGSGALKPLYPDTIAARIGITIVVSLAALLLINVFLVYLERSPNSPDAEGLAAGRLVNAVQILNSCPKAERAAVAAALNARTLGVVLRDTPAITKAEFSLQARKLGRLLRATVADLHGAPLVAERLALSEAADPFAREAPAQPGDFLVQIALPQDQWALLNVYADDLKRNWQHFALRAGISFLIIGLLSVLAARRLAGPIDDFGRAAEQLGTGQEVSPLAERGPRELRVATRAFNQMQERLRRFLEDRTRMLAAISHDLRTPLARLRLRAEFIEDEEQRAKTRTDLDAMSEMINATLVFARDDAQREQADLVDLGVLIADICDDVAELGDAVSLTDFACVPVCCRPAAIGRAISNLIENAVKYGGCARVKLVKEPNCVAVVVDDDGPGIPVDEQERVFAPFYRLEQSRNRDTGGVGLGLAVSRNIAREHGGDVKLSNRTPLGLRARLELPA